MPNNRVTYATSQLSIKDNRADATNRILGFSLDATLASGISAAAIGLINLNQEVSGAWPTAGQVRIKTGTARTEYIRYTSFLTGSGIVFSESTVQLLGWEVPLGVQSVSIGTTFNTEDVFTLGQLDSYENVEGIPEVEVAVERVFDGTKPLWLTGTDFDFSTLKGRTSEYKADIALQVYPDTQDSATDTPDSTVVASGMVVSSYSVSLVTDGNFTESITFVGNDKTWGNEEGVPSGFFATSDAYDAAVIGSGVQRSENFDRAASTLPAEINADDKVQSVEVSVDVTREEIFQLGQKTPFFRAVSFPITVTTTFELITDQGDLVNALGTGADNLVNRTITLVTDAGLNIALGTKNKLNSVTQEGNDAGGGNMTVTLEYQNSNSLTVTHAGFPDAFDSNTDNL
jgi:hypothetical protein